MKYTKLILLVVFPMLAFAESPEVEKIREELRILKSEYEQRIEALEQRLAEMEREKFPASESAYEESFTQVTESRSMAIRQTDLEMRQRVEHVLEDFVDITGYFRAGYGANNEGGPQTGFKAPGAGAKYRLGNEAETYGEISFGKTFFAKGAYSMDSEERRSLPDGPVVHFEMMLAYYNPLDSILDATTTDVSIPQTWASIGNFLESQPDAKFWAGNRYYRRHDIHINDYFYYNMSGAGGGVEDLEMPVGRLALAWIGRGSNSGITSVPDPSPENEASFSKHNWDLRWYDVPLAVGAAEFGITYARRSSGLDDDGIREEAADGFALNMVHTTEDFISENGYNKLSLQYGRGPGLTFTSGYEFISLDSGTYILPYSRDSWRFRFTEHFVANLNDSFSLSPVVVYEITSLEGEDKRHWVSAGVRPIYHLNEYASLAFEAGWDWTRNTLTDTEGSLIKFTVAPQLSLGNRFMNRPVLRAFFTYSTWDDVFQGQIGGPDYANETNGFTTGVQMETWW